MKNVYNSTNHRYFEIYCTKQGVRRHTSWRYGTKRTACKAIVQHQAERAAHRLRLGTLALFKEDKLFRKLRYEIKTITLALRNDNKKAA
jgi:hypothetical protein